LPFEVHQGFQGRPPFPVGEGKRGFPLLIRIKKLNGYAPDFRMFPDPFGQAENFVPVPVIQGDMGEHLPVLRFFQVLGDPIEGSVPEGIVGIPETVQADPEHMGGNIKGNGAVGRDGHPGKKLSRLENKVAESERAIPPEEGFPAFEDDDRQARFMETGQDLQGCLPVHVAARFVSPLMERASGTSEIAPVGDLEASQERDRFSEEFPLHEETEKGRESPQGDAPGEKGALRTVNGAPFFRHGASFTTAMFPVQSFFTAVRRLISMLSAGSPGGLKVS